MSIIVNGTNIPTNGDYIKVGSTLIDKVDVVKNGVRTTVWEKVKDKINTVDVSGWEWVVGSSGATLSINESYVGIRIDSFGDDPNWFTPYIRTKVAIPCSDYKKATIYYKCTAYGGCKTGGEESGWFNNRIYYVKNGIYTNHESGYVTYVGTENTEKTIIVDITNYTSIGLAIGIDCKKPNGNGGGFIGISKVVLSDLK